MVCDQKTSRVVYKELDIRDESQKLHRRRFSSDNHKRYTLLVQLNGTHNHLLLLPRRRTQNLLGQSLRNMVGALKAFALMFLIAISAARNGCRRCAGDYHLWFDKFVTEAVAMEYLGRRLNGCATGDQYQITGLQSTVCTANIHIRQCMSWYFDVEVYRYCGNGGLVIRGLKWTCFETNCFYGDYLRLRCTKSVECAGTCDCTECACRGS